jgi:hypothetical protein
MATEDESRATVLHSVGYTSNCPRAGCTTAVRLRDMVVSVVRP